jgi:hypothetical protein
MPQTPYVVQTTAGMTYKICCSYNFYLVWRDTQAN